MNTNVPLTFNVLLFYVQHLTFSEDFERFLSEKVSFLKEDDEIAWGYTLEISLVLKDRLFQQI